MNILKDRSSNKINNVRNHAWFDEIDDDDLIDGEIDNSCHANEIQHETICMTAEMEVNGKKEWHYNVHGLYGNAMTQEGFHIIAFRSIFHWLIDVFSAPARVSI